MKTPYTVMPNCLDSGRFTIVGFGQDYMVVTVEDDCPGCISGGGIEAIKKVLGSVNCVFICLEGSCGLMGGPSPNHLWIHTTQARRAFPPTDDKWWNTQRFKSLCPKTFEELKQLLAAK
jgi:hypothetical protein